MSLHRFKRAWKVSGKARAEVARREFIRKDIEAQRRAMAAFLAARK